MLGGTVVNGLKYTNSQNVNVARMRKRRNDSFAFCDTQGFPWLM